jgi:hypothetical protein
MPYIDTESRRRLIVGNSVWPETVGELTYKLQQALLDYIQSHELTYQTLADCLGALEGAKADLIERVLKPYEAGKRTQNGDVWPDRMTAR